MGLISGTTYLGAANRCPIGVALGHFDSGPCCSDKKPDQNGFGIGLNKDYPPRQGFTEARAMAVAQTKHEWCRLVSLVTTNYGQAGVDLLFSKWVGDSTAANSACSQT